MRSYPIVMSTSRKIGSVLVLQFAALGVILCAIIIWASWAYNTRVTDSLVRVATGTERVLTAAERGLAITDRGLSTALGAVNTVDGASRAMGERIVDTNIAFWLVERTVGDTLFPRVLAAQDTITAVADTVIGINDTLEAANRLPFVEVPTLSNELGLVGDRLAAVRGRVEEVQGAIREVKERKVARPVAFITARTGPIISDLDSALTTIDSTRTRINVNLARLARLRANLPLIIDTLAVVITLIMLWLIGTQSYVFLRAYENLAGRRVDWAGLRARLRRGDGGEGTGADETAVGPDEL